MSSNRSPEELAQLITQARREAEGLKDRIKRKKDDLADTTREFTIAIVAPDLS
jgi:guanine nucleotide-binding protein G(I)/G(S)/G(T) subunit beta-1